MATIKISPVTRIEGHMDVEVTVDLVGGRPQVVDAKSSGTMFRGFEQILINHDPLDALYFTQRVCGVCPIAHGMASALALEAALGVSPPDNGRIIRNLVLGANFIQSHVLHFYHLSLLDYVDATGLLDMSPWNAHYAAPDLIRGGAASRFIDHYSQALAIRRKAHQAGAIFGGRLPCSPVFVPGGSTEAVAPQKVADFRNLLAEIRGFIDSVYLPDVNEVAALFPAYAQVGRGCGNLLAFGAFNLDAAGHSRLFARGRCTDGAPAAVDPLEIREDVAKAWYSSPTGLNPKDGLTEPDKGKAGAYSWIKAPRYVDKVHEVGPLARMWVNGDYRKGVSVIDRHAARALEARKVAEAMAGWVGQLNAGGSSYTYRAVPASVTGKYGLSEAARGALGHWIDISNSRIARYQILTPTAWNASPTDDAGRKGAMEQALLGTPVRDAQNPIEVLRVIHSFDPCLACAVHVVRPGRAASSAVPGAVAGIVTSPRR